jgi:3-methyl-2-oxobutanoate hydroxymethyltransferase
MPATGHVCQSRNRLEKTLYPQLQMRDSDRPPVSLASLAKMKASGEKIAALTCYDASFAALIDQAGVDVVLVGDSLGMVIQGHDTTVPVTMDQMVYHCQAVARGLHRPMLMADLPFASYPTCETALANAVRLMQEGGAEVVKLESGPSQIEIVKFLSNHDIAVCAHLGLKPQSVHKTGGFRVQGREADAAERMIDSAHRLEAAGADIILLECIPADLGRRVTEALSVPVIGIGAGPHTDGQILVLYDVLGITTGRKPRFVLDCMAGVASVPEALRYYVTVTKASQYPAAEHCFF